MAAKIQIPDNLKADLPPNKFGKILGATPIVMTVIATMLAGLASSEMTKAQYDRALAAQLQSKAGDQWSYFQAKKLRSAGAHNSLDLLAATSDIAAAGRVGAARRRCGDRCRADQRSIAGSRAGQVRRQCSGGAGRFGKFQAGTGNRRRAGEGETRTTRGIARGGAGCGPGV